MFTAHGFLAGAQEALWATVPRVGVADGKAGPQLGHAFVFKATFTDPAL